MAKLNNDSFDGQLPVWFVVQADYNAPTHMPRIRAAIRCIDGDVHILDGEYLALSAGGRTDRYAFKKRAVLEQCRDLINKQLGILALEED
tara:strand:- start:7663 stop:7932 length:270 start_codon:yes stop_codon:yes gene_type:complete